MKTRAYPIHPALVVSIAVALFIVVGFQTVPIFDMGRAQRLALIGAIPYAAIILVVMIRRRREPTMMDLVMVYLALAFAFAAIPFALRA